MEMVKIDACSDVEFDKAVESLLKLIENVIRNWRSNHWRRDPSYFMVALIGGNL